MLTTQNFLLTQEFEHVQKLTSLHTQAPRLLLELCYDSVSKKVPQFFLGLRNGSIN